MYTESSHCADSFLSEVYIPSISPLRVFCCYDIFFMFSYLSDDVGDA